jgi:hypothetical protein
MTIEERRLLILIGAGMIGLVRHLKLPDMLPLAAAFTDVFTDLQAVVAKEVVDEALNKGKADQ